MASGRFEQQRKAREAAARRRIEREDQQIREIAARNPGVVVIDDIDQDGPMETARRIQESFEEVDGLIAEQVRREERKDKKKKNRTGHVWETGLAGDPEAAAALELGVETEEVICPICRRPADDVALWLIHGLRFNRLYTTPPRAECCGECADGIEEGRVDIVRRFEPGTVTVVGQFCLEAVKDVPQARKSQEELLRERLLRSAPHREEQIVAGDSTASPETMLRKMLGR